jgi:hypothetical protein
MTTKRKRGPTTSWVKGYIVVTIKITRAGDQWEATCLELGTATNEDTLEETMAAIEELIQLQLHTLAKHGAAEAFLKKHGLKFHQGTPPKQPSKQSVNVAPNEYVTLKQLPVKKAA